MDGNPKCILTVDAEALTDRASERHVENLIYGKRADGEWGVGKMMEIADRHNVKMTFFLDFAEAELYGNEIIQAGKYIVSRGHDLQIHCHYDILEKKVREHFPKAEKSFYTWCEDDEISDFMIDYCLENYYKCTDHPVHIFRGRGYLFGEALIRKLKQKGFTADASYHCLRPRQLPVFKQFTHENGLLEIPVGVLPKNHKRQDCFLNFNHNKLYPDSPDEYKSCLEMYEYIFREYYSQYGSDAIAVLVMHSWSFLWDRKQAEKTGSYCGADRAVRKNAADFFELFLEHFKNKIDFISAAEAVKNKDLFAQTICFDSIFANTPEAMRAKQSMMKLRQIENLIRQEAGNREVVIWGKGWIEGRIMRVWNLDELLDIAFYISRDAEKTPVWRGKPVKTFEQAALSPDKYYVFLIMDTCYPEIREIIKDIGFRKYKDFYDIADFEKTLPEINVYR